MTNSRMQPVLKGHGFSRADGYVNTGLGFSRGGMFRWFNPIPRGLKAGHPLETFYGTAEAVPFQCNFIQISSLM